MPAPVIPNLVDLHTMCSERMQLMFMCMFLFTNGGKVAKRFSSSCSSERVFHSWGPRFDPDLTHTRSYCRLVWLGSWSECLVLWMKIKSMVVPCVFRHMLKRPLSVCLGNLTDTSVHITVVVVVACEDFDRRLDHSFPICTFFFSSGE